MIKFVLKISVSLLFLNFFTGPPVFAADIAREIITAEAYLKIHPAQVAVAQAFSRFVRESHHPPLKTRKQVRVAVICPGKQMSDYWRRSIRSFRARMVESGIRYALHEYVFSPADGIHEQALQVAKALTYDPDYLIFTIDALRHKRMVEQILAKGRPKVILQNITTPLRSWEGIQPFLYVGFGHATGAKMLAHYFSERFQRNKGGYAVLFGNRGYISYMRGNSFIRSMKNLSDMKMQTAFYTGIDRKKAWRATLSILRDFPDIGFIYACTTDIALGAADALASVGKTGQIAVSGWGGGSPELAAIEAGRLDVTVMRMNDDNGVAMADAIYLDLSGETEAVPTVFSGDMVLVGQKTDRTLLEQLEARAFRYSGTE